MTSLEKTTLELVLAQAAPLYSPPEVALEVLRLTEAADVDLHAIRACLERDPALAVKLLRVVNSSLYGLKGEVNDLNQAIALLGVTPLKMLVLGFSLPDQLFADMMADTLKRYWTETVTRGAAAKLIAEIGWGRGGDEALLTGLLQGIGQLVLIQEFGNDYTDLARSADRDAHTIDRLTLLEQEAIGFDHRTLSAEMMRSWGLPELLSNAIALQSKPEEITHPKNTQVATLAQILRLADLATQLVVHHRLSVLPKLVEEGQEYCRLSKRQINSLVEELQQRVDQLAEGMAIELMANRDYQTVLLEAHAQLSLASETGAGILFGMPPTQASQDYDDRLCDALLAETEQLSHSVRDFLAHRRGGTLPESPAVQLDASDVGLAHEGRDKPKRPHHPMQRQGRDALIQEVDWMTATCRGARQPLTLVMIDADMTNCQTKLNQKLSEEASERSPMIRWGTWLQKKDWTVELQSARWVSLSETRFAMLLPGFERNEVCRLISHAGEVFEQEQGISLDAGVSSIAVVPKGFEAVRLVDAAKRCLDAAIATGTAAVKSIEVY